MKHRSQTIVYSETGRRPHSTHTHWPHPAQVAMSESMSYRLESIEK
ncbi:hypothetical protein K3N28_05680 [Glycomyces sp. TRM65418]|nr:hypothetical protein [Glycomyces sp. TRM65418]MCC3762558.1 hypothetical protein [Glycomyces sp. TRM65418]QZD56597.1 hypothetical protein K3N28_05640 [Glycomyces sp. TRM65418]